MLYSISTIWAFDGTKTKFDVCMKKFCKSLEEYTVEIFNFEKKKTIPLTEKRLNHNASQENHHICKE